MANPILTKDNCFTNPKNRKVVENLLWVGVSLCDAIEYVQKKIRSYPIVSPDIIEVEPFVGLLALKDKWKALYMELNSSADTEVSHE